MKKHRYFIEFLVLIVAEGACYILLNDIIVASVVALLVAVITKQFIMPLAISYANRQHKIEVAYQIINSVIIELSISKNLLKATESVIIFLEDEYQAVFDNRSNIIECYNELGYILNVPLYFVFVKLLQVYERQGGDIMKISSTMLQNLDDYKIKNDQLAKIKKRKWLDYNLLWGMLGIILVYMRFAISSFYLDVVKDAMFKYGLASIFVLFIISEWFFYKKIERTTLDLGGER